MGNCLWLGITQKLTCFMCLLPVISEVPHSFWSWQQVPKPHKTVAPLLLQPHTAELLPRQRRCAPSLGHCTPATCIPGDMLVLPAVAQPKQGAGWAHHSPGRHVCSAAQLSPCWGTCRTCLAARGAAGDKLLPHGIAAFHWVGFVSELCC